MKVTVHDYEQRPGGFTHCVLIEHGEMTHIVFLHGEGWVSVFDKDVDIEDVASFYESDEAPDLGCEDDKDAK